MITSAADPGANIIWGAAFDESLDDEMHIIVIATGFDTHGEAAPKPAAPQINRVAYEEAASNRIAEPEPRRVAPPAPAPSAASTPTPENSDDKDFIDIMKIFKHHK